FSYRDYLASRGIGAVLYPQRHAHVHVTEHGLATPILAAADIVRRRMTSFLLTALPGQRGALMASLLLGDDGAIGPEARDDFARSGLLHVLVVAALALLVSQPLLLFDAGFQLSFAATWGLIFVAPVLTLHLSALPRSLRSLFAMTVAEQIAVGPLLAYHFLQISVVGLAAN